MVALHCERLRNQLRPLWGRGDRLWLCSCALFLFLPGARWAVGAPGSARRTLLEARGLGGGVDFCLGDEYGGVLLCIAYRGGWGMGEGQVGYYRAPNTPRTLTSSCYRVSKFSLKH